MQSRRDWLVTAARGLALAAAATVPAPLMAALQSNPGLTVYKDEGCGCCRKWVDHMRASGFGVTAHDVPDIDVIKQQLGVPQSLASCHTALVGGYVVEGHVPAAVVRRLLKERPQVAGIAVPGMPVGSPGMEMGDRRDPYDVIAFARDGKTSVFAKQ
jgi:hypothetical protein